MEVPCVAIGGITVANCRPVIAAGADFLAVAGGVWNYADGPQAAVTAFNKIFSSYRAPRPSVPPPAALGEAGEVSASYADGGVMSITTGAHAPSARFAGTS